MKTTTQSMGLNSLRKVRKKICVRMKCLRNHSNGGFVKAAELDHIATTSSDTLSESGLKQELIQAVSSADSCQGIQLLQRQSSQGKFPFRHATPTKGSRTELRGRS